MPLQPPSRTWRASSPASAIRVPAAMRSTFTALSPFPDPPRGFAAWRRPTDQPVTGVLRSTRSPTGASFCNSGMTSFGEQAHAALALLQRHAAVAEHADEAVAADHVVERADLLVDLLRRAP